MAMCKSYVSLPEGNGYWMGSKNKKAQMKYKQFDMEYHVFQVFQAEQSYPWEIHRTADFLLAMNLILED